MAAWRYVRIPAYIMTLTIVAKTLDVKACYVMLLLLISYATSNSFLEDLPVVAVCLIVLSCQIYANQLILN